MTTLRVLPVTIVFALAVACSHGSTGAGRSGSPSALAAGSPDVVSLSRETGCTGFDRSGQTELYVREQISCALGGSQITVYTFNDRASQQQWLDVARGFGGVYVIGDRWVVSTDDQATAQAVKGKLGGEIR
jgi:hypothetical protein